MISTFLICVTMIGCTLAIITTLLYIAAKDRVMYGVEKLKSVPSYIGYLLSLVTQPKERNNENS